MSARLEAPEEAAARLAGEPLTASERALLWQRLEAEVGIAQRRRRTRFALVFGAPALAIAATLLIAYWPRDTRDVARQQARAKECALDARAPQLRLGARCAARSVRIDGDEWALSPGAEVARTDGGVRVVAGRVRFHVRPRTPEAQFRVRVSDGEVRVIGTVFQIEQAGGHGTLAVTKGVVEFAWRDGVRERVAAGQTLRWPRVTARAVPPQPVAPVPAATNPPAAAAATPDTDARDAAKLAARATAEMDRTMERLLQLQSQKRFGEAVMLLRATLAKRGLTPVQSERISYELGLALEASGSPDCAHWRQHVQRFGAQRHAAAVARRLERCR